MNTLALDTSSKAASCALLAQERLVGEFYLDCGLTHSQTLMPMVEALCAGAGLAPAQIGRVAVSRGPGSFTGLRIGMAAAKSLAAALGAPCAGVSTLLSLCYNLRGCEGLCCAVLDARCRQVYFALFSLAGGAVTRLCEDAAAPLAAFQEALGVHLAAAPVGSPVFLVGDGAKLCYTEVKDGLPAGTPLRLAPDHLLLCRAAGVGYAALAQGEWGSAQALAPAYLRLSQAERELMKKQEGSL